MSYKVFDHIDREFTLVKPILKNIARVAELCAYRTDLQMQERLAFARTARLKPEKIVTVKKGKTADDIALAAQEVSEFYEILQANGKNGEYNNEDLQPLLNSVKELNNVMTGKITRDTPIYNLPNKYDEGNWYEDMCKTLFQEDFTNFTEDDFQNLDIQVLMKAFMDLQKKRVGV